MPVKNENQDFPKGVYVSASSDEKERAKKWMDALRAKGIPVTSTWYEEVAKNGGIANPRDASLEDKQKWCRQDIKEALSSAVLWLLLPVEKHSFGATFEYTTFVVLSDPSCQSHVVSGDYKKTIFTSFSPCFDSDEEAFEQIVAAFDAAKLEASAAAK